MSTFVAKHLGGVGCEPDGFTFHLTRAQRKYATYFGRKPDEWILRETVSELPAAAALALVKQRRCLPDPVWWMEGGRPVQGPLPYEESSAYVDDLLIKCLRSTAYKMGHPESTKYRIVTQLRRALAVKECLMSEKKIRKGLRPLLRYPMATRPWVPEPRDDPESLETDGDIGRLRGQCLMFMLCGKCSVNGNDRHCCGCRVWRQDHFPAGRSYPIEALSPVCGMS
jgi:hypothetical protein